jgi:hypothetical protein
MIRTLIDATKTADFPTRFSGQHTAGINTSFIRFFKNRLPLRTD